MHTNTCSGNDFYSLFEDYTNGLDSPKVKTLKELIDFYEQHREIELQESDEQEMRMAVMGSSYKSKQSLDSPRQDNLIQSLEAANTLTDAEYNRLDAKATASAADDAIDKTLHSHNVDVIIGPADSRLPDVIAVASKSVPCLLTNFPHYIHRISFGDSGTWIPGMNRRPFELLVTGSKYQDGLLLDVACLWEATFPRRKTPDLDYGVAGC